jgi:hypothetical protein
VLTFGSSDPPLLVATARAVCQQARVTAAGNTEDLGGWLLPFNAAGKAHGDEKGTQASRSYQALIFGGFSPNRYVVTSTSRDLRSALLGACVISDMRLIHICGGP